MNESPLKLDPRAIEPSKDGAAVLSNMPTDTSSTIRLGILVLLIGFGSLLLWAAFAPLDEGVPAAASVMIDTKRKVIQHMTGGTIARVAVKEGQHVNVGDILIELDSQVPRANNEIVRQSYLANRAIESRLLAEIEERPVISFHPDVIAASSNPTIKQYMNTQIQLLDSKRIAFRHELAAIDEAIAGQVSLLGGIKLQIESREVQSKKQGLQLKSMSDLATSGFVSKNQLLQLEQNEAELKAVLAELEGSRLRAERAIEELKLRKSQRMSEAKKESMSQLADVRRDVEGDYERLGASRSELARTKITAPVSGQVVGLSVASIGGVVSPGQNLLDLVPADEAVVLEARIPIYSIDRIHVGDEVAVRFAAFAHTPQLVVDAVIDSISNDTISEQTPMGMTVFYLARVSLTPQGLKMMGNHKLQPGMGAEVLIKTGERSLLTYLLHPLTKRIASALKEE
jgi:protease secretion system membrane fusion protein